MIRNPVLAARLRYIVVSNLAVLIVGLVGWRAQDGLSPWDMVLIAALTLPLFIAVPKLLAGDRRTYAWMTLAITPFIVVGITEAVANPESRVWAGLCLMIGFLVFALLIAYLRVSRDNS
jgi:uncharacterized membrane protein